MNYLANNLLYLFSYYLIHSYLSSSYPLYLRIFLFIFFVCSFLRLSLLVFRFVFSPFFMILPLIIVLYIHQELNLLVLEKNLTCVRCDCKFHWTIGTCDSFYTFCDAIEFLIKDIARADQKKTFTDRHVSDQAHMSSLSQIKNKKAPRPKKNLRCFY